MSSDPALLIKRLLVSMDDWGASDVFLTEDRVPHARIHGALVDTELAPTSGDALHALANQVLGEVRFNTFLETGDADAGFEVEGERFRINFARQGGKISAVVRALQVADLMPEALGIPEPVAQLADALRGLVLVTGATGSGKSTTMAALVHRINNRRRAHIVTIEDPIEFVHKDIRSRVSQREVGRDTVSFAAALRGVVRQSPDVIVIGEIRDYETVAVALSAALTGHLVLATLHTIDTTQTLQRILNYFPEHLRGQAAMDLSMCLNGVVCQRLLPRSDARTRVLASEVLTVKATAQRLIRELRIEELQDLMKASSDPGVITFSDSLLALYQSGAITYEQGEAYATNPAEFALAARGMRTGVATFKEDNDRISDGARVDMKALLKVALARGASDLHVAVGRPPIFRIDGALHRLAVEPFSASDVRVLLFSILSGRQRTAYELERELDFALSLDDGQRFRVNAYFQKGKMAASLRTIATVIPDAQQLGIPPQVLSLVDRAHGLLLVAGPTGSGKTTTLACLVDRINRSRKCRIITVEDPIEYVHEGIEATIDQREVHSDTKSFGHALKYVLRQDPDVIMVGEMRDHEAVAAAVTAAETGHLVLATLHTNDAVKSIDRIVDVFPPHQQPQVRAQVASSLLGVVSQRLLQRRDGGRVGAFEVLIANPAVRTLIRDGRMHQCYSAMETGKAAGMVTMDNALVGLLQRGLITKEEATRYIRNPKILGTY